MAFTNPIAIATNQVVNFTGAKEGTWGIALSTIASSINSAVPDNARIQTITLNFSGTARNHNIIFYTANTHAFGGLTGSDGDLATDLNGGTGNCTLLFHQGPFRIDGGETLNLNNQSIDITDYFNASPPHSVQNTNFSRLSIAFTDKATYQKTFTFNISITVEYEIPTYTVTTSVNDSNGGWVSLQPVGGNTTSSNKETYNRGTALYVTAYPEKGWKFVRWEGSSNSTDTLLTVTVNSDLNYKAIFEKDKFNVTLTIKPEGAGTATGAGTYTYQDIATLTAHPNPGWDFYYWYRKNYISEGGTNPLKYQVDYQYNDFECVFQKQVYTIDRSVTPEAAGWVEFTNLSRESQAYNGVYYGDIIRLEAHPSNALEYEFAYWADDKNNTNQIREFTATKSVNYQAVFRKRLHKITYDKELYINGEKWGIISGPEPGSYEYGTQLNFSIEIINNVDYNYKYEFYYWDFNRGDIINGTTKDTSIIYEVISEDHITARCAYSANIKYNFSVGVEDEAAGYITGAVSGIYLNGTELTFTAVPKEGYKFVKWKDNSSINPTRTITLTSDVTYIAIFEKKHAALDFYANQYGDLFLYNQKGENVPSAGNYYYGEEFTLLFVPKENYKFLNFVYSSIYEEQENPLSIPYGEISQNPLTFSIVGENIAVIRVVCEEKESHFISIKNINIHKKNGEIINQQYSDHFYEDTLLELEPKAPNSLSRFVEWGGDLSGSEIPKIYTVTKDAKLEAVFKQLQMKFKSVKVLHHSTNEVASPTNPLVGGENGDQAIIQVKIALE